MSENEKLEKLEKQIRERKCLYCSEKIKSYTLTGLPIPYEGNVYYDAKNSAQIGLPAIVRSWGDNSNVLLDRIVLVSTCSCGNVTLWNCDEDTFSMLTSKKMYSDGYGIDTLYNKSTLEYMIEKTENEKFKKQLIKLKSLLYTSEEN